MNNVFSLTQLKILLYIIVFIYPFLNHSQTPIAQSTTVYRNSAATIYVTYLNGTVVWQESPDGSNWTDVSSGSNTETSLTSSTIAFSFTGSEQNWVVPAGVTYIDVDGYGAKGGRIGGLGGRVEAKLLTIPGEDLKIYIGGLGSGNGGFNGGGGGPIASGRGGGATDIRQNGNSLANRIYVAGGGGGGGQNYGSSTGCTGGVGGGLTGGNGHRCGNGGNGGIGGSQTAGGANGGELGVGGAGFHAAQTSASGAGGGGFYGGGGGSLKKNKKGGGGGGGSSYTDSTATDVVHTQGYAGANGNGSLTITTPTRITSTYTSAPLTNNIYYRAVINGVTTSAVTITIVSAPPTDILLTTNIISETASIGSLIGTLSATDPDTSISSLTFTLANSGDAQDDDNGSFTISGTSLLTSTTLDYETKTSYNIYVNVNDGTTNYAKAFTVFVTNVLEPITDLGFHVSKAYKFNGTNNYIEVPYAAENHPSNFTIELWARLDQDTGTYQSPLSSRYGSYPWNNLSGYNFYAIIGLEKWSFTGGSGKWEEILATSSTNGEIYDGNNLKFGIWTHLASTYDGTIYRFYVNGVLAGSKTAGYSRVGFNSIPPVPLRIGAGTTESSPKYYFNGAVDEVRIWNYARTQNEININKNAVLSGQETGLVSYYSFDNGNASNDTGVSARDGTLYNSPTVITRNTPYEANIDEESSLGTIVGTLTATDSDTTDFTFSLVAGDGTNDRNNSSFTISGTQLLVNGTIDYETTPTLNIYVQASDGTNTFAKALTVNVNDVNELPVISSTSIASDNSTVSVIFSESVFGGTSQATTTLAADDFNLSLTGGSVTLSSTTPSSITVNGSAVQLGLSLTGTPNGNEVITVTPIANAIFDVQGATASSTQSNNTVNLKADSDGDGIDNNLDNCPSTANADQLDTDGDGIGDVCDNAPIVSNSNQLDTDGDGVGDVSDTDDDGDGVADSEDAFPLDATESADTDGDGVGDSADPDLDNDGVLDTVDNCIYTPNADQLDTDADGVGNVCDSDDDGDGFSDEVEITCGTDPLLASSKPLDTDNDGIANCIDTDDDNDGFLDTDEATCGSDPLDATSMPLDTDTDGTPNCIDTDDDNDSYLDENDAFPLDAKEWLDTDADGIGNNTDTDDDGDGQLDTDEIACGSDPLLATSMSLDTDGDSVPDCVDTDDDNDGVIDTADAFPLDPAEWTDTDSDGIGNNADTDDDNDGQSDYNELVCGSDPLDQYSKSSDIDSDSIPDCVDEDIDGDGYLNEEDAFPEDGSEWVDTDGDGLGDNFEVDDDNDGYLDSNDAFPLDPNEWADADNDGIGDNEDPDDNNDGFEDNKLFASGALTPGSGGLEDTWKIINIEQYPTNRVSVYDKNGNEVFSAANYKNNWRGTFKESSNPLPAGSYYYIVDLNNGGEQLKGWLYITY